MLLSKAELFLGALAIGQTSRFPQTTICNILEFVNLIFAEKQVPDSRYKLDKLCNPEYGVKYHAICPACKLYVREFKRDKPQVKCNVCSREVVLDSFENFFVTFDIKDQVRDLLETHDVYYDNVISAERNDLNVWSDIYDGRVYRRIIESLPARDRLSYVTITFNSDGSPVFKSSKTSIWPMQLLINELPFEIRYEEPIIQALWFGKDKPDMSIFLKTLVDEMNEVSENGILCKINGLTKKIRVYCICCCVDSVARAPVQGLKQLNGYSACSWCLHPGQMVLHKVAEVIKYPLLDQVPQERQELESIVHIGEKSHGFQAPTPLLLLKKFNIIDGFVPDPMHCVALGVIKQFTKLWFRTSWKPYSIPRTYKTLIGKLLEQAKSPTKVGRLTRPLTDMSHWKSKELDTWGLHYSVPYLKIVPNFERYVEHWSLFVEAYSLLLQRNITLQQLQRSSHLLITFVGETEILYGADAMTYNVHQLLHLPSSVVNWGPLWAHFGYPFENGNGNLLKMIKAAKGIVYQIIRYINRKQSQYIASRTY